MNGFPENRLGGGGPAPILVLGLGNMLLSDDGVGPAVLADLVRRENRWQGKVEFLDGGTQGLALLGHLSGRRALVIVDAVRKGEAPGTVYQLTLPELREMAMSRASSGHESNAGELLAVVELLGELPDRLFVVGVEPGKVTTGLGLSPAVQKALSAAGDQVASLLEQLS
jgi:hydrogenase maturation protease